MVQNVPYERHRLDDEERREFLKALGVAGVVAGGSTALSDVTLSDLRDVVTVESADELAAEGEAIRTELEGTLDASLIQGEMAALADQIERLPELRAMGIPETRDAELYRELTRPAWRIEHHLVDVGFFEVAENHFSLFSSEHIAATTNQLIETGALAEVLSGVEFDEHEQTELVMDIVTNQKHLAQWVPVSVYSEAEYGIDEESIDPETVAPLHQRASEGALLWIDGLDYWLWQNKVLITDQILDRGAWDVKAMLGGFYLMGRAVDGLARAEIADEVLTALVTASTGILIVGQFNFANDVTRITDQMRAPSPHRGGV